MHLHRSVIACAIALLSFLPGTCLGQPPAPAPKPRPSEHNGFLYQPSKGSFWDPTVIYANGQYYMFTMYGRDSVWLATSKDGVHWQDYGVVLKSEGFKNNTIFKQYVSKVGDRYIMDYGAFTAPGSNNNLLRFYESPDLIHWKYLYELPIDTNFYRADGRWDHMFMVPKSEANPGAGYFGYVVAAPIGHGGFGMMESADGVHYKPIKPPEIIADFALPTLEVGGIKKFGNKYYLIAGAVNHFGFSGFGVYTYTSDSPTGPFRPDLDAYRLTGTSGIDGDTFINILTAFVKDSPEPLVSEPLSLRNTLGTDGEGVWFLPMRKAIVDSQGHLRLAYWNQNDLAKGDSVPLNPAENTVLYPPGQTPANPIIRVAATPDSITVHTDRSWREFSWLDGFKSRKGVVILNQRFDLDRGIIVEGTLKASPPGGRANGASYAGFYVEGADKGPGTAIMLEIGEPQWRESQIGKLSLNDDFHFEPLDVIGRNTAALTGLDSGKDHTFRLWLRGGQMELYVDDLLVQSFFVLRTSGRIGFVARESEAQFSNLKVYQMNFSTAKKTAE